MATIKLACVQLRSSDNIKENISVASTLIRQARSIGADLIATPEMTSLLDRRPGALLEKSRIEEKDEALAAFRELAAEVGAWILIGSLPIRVDPTKCANRSFLLSPSGEIAASYDKIHMFDVDIDKGNVYKESNSYRAGTKAVVVDIPQVRIGLSICYDVRFPYLYRTLAKAGSGIIAIPSSFTRVSGEAHWDILIRARAIENGCFVVAPAQGGLHADGRETYGHSLIVGPWGEVLAEAQLDPGIISVTVDLTQVDDARRRIPSLKHDRSVGEP